jgi:hypothetical protein
VWRLRYVDFWFEVLEGWGRYGTSKEAMKKRWLGLDDCVLGQR